MTYWVSQIDVLSTEERQHVDCIVTDNPNIFADGFEFLRAFHVLSFDKWQHVISFPDFIQRLWEAAIFSDLLGVVYIDVLSTEKRQHVDCIVTDNPKIFTDGSEFLRALCVLSFAEWQHVISLPPFHLALWEAVIYSHFL